MISSLSTRFSVDHFPVVLILWATAVGCLASGVAVATSLHIPVRVEVFSTTDHIVAVDRAIATTESGLRVDLQVYELEGIQLVEAALSKDLPADPNQSKSLTLRRFQVLDDQLRERMHRSAIGIAKMMQYGLDRYPAIVFDRQVVVYGVTDLQVALTYYEAWQKVANP
ncbi:MAG TPA: TIGR03757 family integrating conjugative element protein [Gammaproteobacteria bacterium]|nr:TIGR03757 family integrating conjugative element protein [Gammaproteobacteria bacterium]